MGDGAATGVRTARPEDRELRRLREDLYRPSPPPDAVARYTALLDRQQIEPRMRPERAAGAPRPAPPGLPGLRRSRLLRSLLVAGVVVALVVAALVVGSMLRTPRDPSRAEPLTTGGPYAVADRDALRSLLDPAGTDQEAVLRAVRGSTLPQLDVWDRRDGGVWLQTGRGPLSRRFDGTREPSPTARPFSIAVQCGTPARYRWTILGTTRGNRSVHVLETAGSVVCGRTPTVATFTRPAGAVVRGFDLRIGPAVRWGMAFVYPTDVD